MRVNALGRVDQGSPFSALESKSLDTPIEYFCLIPSCRQQDQPDQRRSGGRHVGRRLQGALRPVVGAVDLGGVTF